jgi:hypothetical protein
MVNKNIQDERQSTLYGDKPIIIGKERYSEIINYYCKCHKNSYDWFKRNYEQDFIRYFANYLSIPGEIYKPWSEANDYFMPATNINVETILARTLETIRGGRDFVTIFPRGRDDEQKSKIIQLYLRYTFENKMKGYTKLVDGYRTKLIYGTSIYSMPWELEYCKKKIPGVYIYDKETKEFIKEIQEEATEGKPTYKDFSGVDVKPILDSNPSFVIKDLFEDVKLKDNSNLELLDIFNVKIDPTGGNDIQKHRFTIVETVETIDTIRRKAYEGIYDKEQVNALIGSFSKDKSLGAENTSANLTLDNPGLMDRNSIDGKSNDDLNVENGVKIWICYGRHEIGYDRFEEETITVIANQNFLLRFTQTPFEINGQTYRPLLVDRFITLPHRFYGIGVCQVLESLNYLLNHLVNQILNHGDLYNSPPLIIPTEGQFEVENNILGPGQTWQSDNSDGFKILETPDIKSSQVTMITFIEGFMQKTLGISDFTLGQGSGNIVKNDTAHGMANILRETNRRLDFYATNSQELFLKAMFEMIIWEAQKFLDEEEIPKITDMDKEEIKFTFNKVTNENVQGLYDVKIFADSLTASKEFEQIKWQTQIQMLGQLQDPITGMPLYDMRKMGDKWMEAFGEPYPEKLHYQPPPEALAMGMTPETPDKSPPNLNTPTEKMKNPEGRLGPIANQ